MLKGVIAATSVAAEALDSAPARMARMNMEVLGIGYAPGGLRISAAVVCVKWSPMKYAS